MGKQISVVRASETNGVMRLELYYDGDILGCLEEVAGELRLHLYPKPEKTPWVLPYEEFLEVLKLAPDELL